MENGMKYCINCGTKMPETAAFCSNCGAKQSLEDVVQDSVQSLNKESTECNDNMNRARTGLFSSTKRYFDDMFIVSKRMSRADYWWGYLGLTIFGLLLYAIYLAYYLDKPTMGSSIENGFFFYSVPRFIGLIIICLIFVSLAVMNFSAQIRRLHDSNRSGYLLWLMLIPLIGSILTIIFLCQDSDSRGSRFDKRKLNKSWMKRWWTWLILIGFSLGLAISLDNVNFDTIKASFTDTPNESTTDDDDTTDDSDEESDDNTVSIDESDVTLEDTQIYKCSFEDDGWSGAEVSVPEVKVATTGGFTYDDGDGDKEYEGLVMIKFNIKANEDISIKPTHGTLITDDGQQIEADSDDSDDFDGLLDSGTNDSGYVKFPIKNLNSVNQFDSISINFDASYDTGNSEVDDPIHTYDINLDFDN